MDSYSAAMPNDPDHSTHSGATPSPTAAATTGASGPEASHPGIAIREATMDDLPAIAAIYNEQVRTSVATFDVEERGTAYLGEKLAAHRPGDLVIVATHGDDVVGYALSGPFRPRPAYAGTRETSVYVAEGARGLGLGRRLYAVLLGTLDGFSEVHTQVAVIALPNPASEALHRSFGFDHVGTLREVGQKFGRFVDTAWYQRLPRSD
jgi:L-amino acid N-acyltransferase YncA